VVSPQQTIAALDVGSTTVQYAAGRPTAYVDDTGLQPVQYPLAPGNIAASMGLELFNVSAACNECVAKQPSCCSNDSWAAIKQKSWYTVKFMYQGFPPSVSPYPFSGSYLPSCWCDEDGRVAAQVWGVTDDMFVPAGSTPSSIGQFVWVACE